MSGLGWYTFEFILNSTGHKKKKQHVICVCYCVFSPLQGHDMYKHCLSTSFSHVFCSVVVENHYALISLFCSSLNIMWIACQTKQKVYIRGSFYPRETQQTPSLSISKCKRWMALMKWLNHPKVDELTTLYNKHH